MLAAWRIIDIGYPSCREWHTFRLEQLKVMFLELDSDGSGEAC